MFYKKYVSCVFINNKNYFNQLVFSVNYTKTTIIFRNIYSQVPVGEPITYNVGYKNFYQLGENWSGKGVYKDYSSHYPVVTYSDHAKKSIPL